MLTENILVEHQGYFLPCLQEAVETPHLSTSYFSLLLFCLPVCTFRPSQLPASMLVEWRETVQAHVRRAVGENPEIQGVWIPSGKVAAAAAAPAAGAKGAPAAAAAAGAAAPQNGESPFSSAISSFLQTPVAELTVGALIGAEAAAVPAGEGEVAWRDLLLRLVHARREDDAQPEAFRLGMRARAWSHVKSINSTQQLPLSFVFTQKQTIGFKQQFFTFFS